MGTGECFSFSTKPSNYKHLSFSVEGPIGTIVLQVNENEPFKPEYKLKLNSYDLSVDIELADILNRLRFEYPQVNCVVITSPEGKVFCAGANIFMLRTSSHSFKVNFCKFTNETRLYIEDASRHSGIKFLCAANGVTAGGGYELALACDEIALIDDGNSAISLPEVPLLGVLPGTGGLTRITDKRRVRKDHCDIFCTVAEGIKGKRAAEWRLVDAVIPRSEWSAGVKQLSQQLSENGRIRSSSGIVLNSIEPTVTADSLMYSYVQVKLNEQKRCATICIKAPADKGPASAVELFNQGCETWSLKAFREIDDAILRLRFHYRDIGLISIKTEGSGDNVVAHDEALLSCSHNPSNGWLAKEIMWYQARVLRRIDVTARTFVTLIEPNSAFAGSLAELVWASDRSYLLKDREREGVLQLSSANLGRLPMGNGISRLEAWFWGNKEGLRQLYSQHNGNKILADACERMGLVSFVCDEIDYEDEVRIFTEERASLSPDALTGMEANLRFVGPETMESKIFSRLSAWQNWIFTRDNATGPSGALSCYGTNTTAKFNFERC